MRFKKSLLAWHFCGCLAIMSLAALWHFVYAWTPNVVAAVIFPVNESVWEHMKLFLVPSVIFFVIEYIAIGYRFRNYIFSHGIALLVMPASTLAMFYFYRSVANIEENLLLDIIITFISICIGMYAGFKLTVKTRKIGTSVIAVFIALILAIAYGILTFFPPKVPMFLDTNTGGYGIKGSEYSPDYVPIPTPEPAEESTEEPADELPAEDEPGT